MIIIGVEAAKHAKIIVIMSPVGPYFPTGFKPIKLYAGERFRLK